MDKISSFTQRNPIALAQAVGHRLRDLRLAKGWTQDELAERSGIALSTLKLLEAKGQGSFQRLIRVAVALDVDCDLRNLFGTRPAGLSIDDLKRAGRQRAPRRQPKGAPDGT